MKIKQFLSNRDALEDWLKSEYKVFENNAGVMSYSFIRDRIDITALDNHSGEFIINSDGKVEMYIEEGPGEIIYSGGGMATNEKVLFELFKAFKEKLRDENT